MNKKATESMRVLARKRVPMTLAGCCALLAAVFLPACSSDSAGISPGTKKDATIDQGGTTNKDTAPPSDVPGSGPETPKTDAPITPDLPVAPDAPAGCSVGGQFYSYGQSVVIPGNCPTTCVCLSGGSLGSCYSTCPTPDGSPPADTRPPTGDAPPTCSWAGGTYSPGQRLPLNDGCGGSCVCLSDGTVGACTGPCPVDGGPDTPPDIGKRDQRDNDVPLDVPADYPVDQPLDQAREYPAERPIDVPPIDTACTTGDPCTVTGGGQGICNAGVCGACAGAQADARCTAVYGAGNVCVSGRCVVGCNDSGDCTGGKICNTAAHSCVACNAYTHDAGDPELAADNRCKADTTYGSGTICLNGACTRGDCHDSNNCNAGRICGSSVANACGDCTTDQQCRQDTSRYGTGYICLNNLCVQGTCHTTSDCTTAGQVCNSTTHTCGACTSDTQCRTDYGTARPICVTTTGATGFGLCVANTNLCPSNNVTCPRNSSDFCCAGSCVPGNCCTTEQCAAVDPVYVCQGNLCTHCDAVTGRSYFVDPVNGSDDTGNGSRAAGGTTAADCAFQTLKHALDVIGTPTNATTITIIGPATLASNPTTPSAGESPPFVIPANVTVLTQGGAVTVSLRTGEQGFSVTGAPAGLSPAPAAPIAISRATAAAVTGYGFRVESGVTGAITLSNLTITNTGSNAIEIASGTVRMTNVTVASATGDGIRVTSGDVTLNSGVQVTDCTQDGLSVSGGRVSISNGTATNPTTLFNANGRYGISVSQNSVLSVVGEISGNTRSAVVQNNVNNNINFDSSSNTPSSINGLYDFGSRGGDGLHIIAGSRITVRNSTFLGNSANGIHIFGSGTAADDVLTERIDLGSGTAGDLRGRNTLQVANPPTSQNGGAGLCVGALSTNAGAQTVQAQANIFPGDDCGSNSNPAPTVVRSTSCNGSTDIGVLAQPTGASVNVNTQYCVPAP
jgi:hypothetical protein